MNRIVRALTRNVAETSSEADEPRLRTRTYRISFDDVWYAALLVAGSLPGWKVVRADDREGLLIVEARTKRLGMVDDVAVHVRLDENGRTIGDMRSSSRFGVGDLGANARRIEQFFDALDDQLQRWGKEPALPGRG
jgi:uncharacterized protein (DUF1499 family)